MKAIITTYYSLKDCHYREVWAGTGRRSRLTVEKWVTGVTAAGQPVSFLRGIVCERAASRFDRVERIIHAIECCPRGRMGSWLHHAARSLVGFHLLRGKCSVLPGAIDRYRSGATIKANFWPSDDERVAHLKYWYWN